MYFYHTHACGDSKCLKTGAAWDPPNCMEAGVMGFRCALWGGPGSGCGTGSLGPGLFPNLQRGILMCSQPQVLPPPCADTCIQNKILTLEIC